MDIQFIQGYHAPMCAHYQQIKLAEKLWRRYLKDQPPDWPFQHDLWPGYLAPFIRNHQHAHVGDDAVPAREVVGGIFGMVPHWAKDLKIARQTYNARSETVAEKPSFRDAWRKGQRCIIPADVIFEPDWRSGKAVPTKIFRKDGEPLGLAGLWAWSPLNDGTLSFTMLTMHAGEHSVMKQFHKPDDEKRSVVILPDSAYDAWLDCRVKDQVDFLHLYPAEELETST